MIKYSIFLKSVFSHAPLALLPVSSVVTPLAVLATSNDINVELNAKRSFNPNEESGLNYNTTGGFNPFLSIDSTATTYNLEDLFYTRRNHLSHNDYKSFEWSNLSPSGPKEPISLWLSQLTNYLEDPENKYPVQITSAKPDEYKGGQDDFLFNNDFSSNQHSQMVLNWRTQQMGFALQDSLNDFVSSNHGLAFPRYIQQSTEYPTSQYLWKSLTGSNFYTNYTDVKDPETNHYPHKYNFNLKTPAKYLTAQYSTNQPDPGPTPSIYTITFNDGLSWNGPNWLSSTGSAQGLIQNLDDKSTVEVINSKYNFDEQTKLLYLYEPTGNVTIKKKNKSSNSLKADTPSNINGTKIYFDFPSEYLPESKTSALSTVNSLSSIFNLAQPAEYTPSSSTISIPAKTPYLHWFGFDSKEEKTIKADFPRAGEKIFSELYPSFISGEDDSKIFQPMERSGERSLNNMISDQDQISHFSYYIPTFTTKGIYSQNPEFLTPQALSLPEEQKQDFPSSQNEAYVNFMDYYNLDNQSSLSCDVSIKGDSNLLTYDFKSGGKTVSTREIIISPEFKQFFNMCLSSMQTDIKYADYNDLGLNHQSDNSYLSLKSTGDNSIINLKSTIGSSSSIDENAPFSQMFPDENSSNSISAQSLGFGFSASNDSLLPISSKTEQKNVHYLLNLGLVFNKTSLVASSTGYSNKLMVNLDYLLAIDPTTTSFYNHSTDGGKTITPVEIKLNPYYIQAAANAHSAYNFWLTFLKNNYNRLTQIRGGQKRVIGAFRDLIMRGFIKSQKQADKLVTNLQNKAIEAAVAPEMLAVYDDLQDVKYVQSYAKLSNPKAKDFSYKPCNDFAWNVSSFPTSTIQVVTGNEKKSIFVWPDENGEDISAEPGSTKTISQSTWAPFCWQYGISPITWSFLKSIPNDYTFEIPYGYIYNNPVDEKSPTSDFGSGNLSGTKIEQTPAKITWSSLLHGDSIKFNFDVNKLIDKEKWNNVSLVIGSTGSGLPDGQGVHGYLPSGAKEKTAITKEGAPVSLSIPKFGSIKLATISNNNHINSTTTNSAKPFDINIIQQYSTKSNRDKYIKTQKDINYVSSDKSPCVLAFHKSEKTIIADTANNMSNNTYVVTKVNKNNIDLDESMDNYFTIDKDGTLGVELEIVKWRESLEEIRGKNYKSQNENITGKYSDQLQDIRWSMEGIAPEDWFDPVYKTTYGDYSTYKWAFHPSGLWSYKMQFYQDPDAPAVESGEDSWDALHQKYNLDYSIWGKPLIEPITRTSYVPDRIINGADGQSGWKKKAKDAGVNNPVFYTNNPTLELAFRVTYKDFAFTSTLFPGKKIMPVQYVYIPKLTYTFGLTKKSTSLTVPVETYTNLNNQYGDFAPSYLDRWVNNNEAEQLDSKTSLFSTHDLFHLLDTNEIINFYKSYYTNGLYKSNVYYNNFLNLYKHGWIYIQPVSINNSEHSLSFKIYYDRDIIVNQSFFESGQGTKLSILNEDYVIQTLPNKQQVKVPLIPEVTPDPTGQKTTSVKWYSTDTITINNFRCVGTEWSTVKGQNKMTPFVIGLIVAVCVTPVLIVLTGVGLHKVRTKVKKLK